MQVFWLKFICHLVVAIKYEFKPILTWFFPIRVFLWDEILAAESMKPAELEA